MIDYRKDVDALRGYAVLAVVFYHFNIPYFQGGFLGVDIFFVISGYLITSIIFLELKSNNFSFINFYERRIRRIIPILFFVLFTTTIIQSELLIYDEKINFYKALLSIIFFISNLWFAKSGTYFEPEISQSHLLHTWSLSIEEQFYLIFPLLLFFFYKKRVFFILLTIFVVSLLLANNGGVLKYSYPFYDEFKFIKTPGNNFYLMPTRLWELLAGSMIAIFNIKFRKNYKFNFKNKIKNLLNIIGYFIIFISFIIFSEKIPHPSIITIFPILGISIILFLDISKNKSETILEKIFTNKYIIKVGLISYSLYLWHLPILYFYHDYFGPEKLNFLEILFLITLSFTISIFSYNFIEKFFRKKFILKKGQTLIFFFIITLILGSFAFYKINFYNFKKDYSKDIIRIIDEKIYFKDKFFVKCLSDPRKYISPKDSCIIGDTKKIKYAFLGDSHMGILSKELNINLKEKNIGGHLLSYNGCLPSNELKILDQERYKCTNYYNEVLEFLKNDNRIKKVILFYRWDLYYNGTRFDNKLGGKEKGEDHFAINVNSNNHINEFNIDELNLAIKNFLKEIKALGIEIIIIKSTPEMGWEIPTFLAKKILRSEQVDRKFLSVNKNLFLERNINFNKFLNNLKDDLDLYIYNPEKLFCNNSKCFAHENNYPLFYDDDHLSSFGSKQMTKDLIKFMNKKNLL